MRMQDYLPRRSTGQDRDNSVGEPEFGVKTHGRASLQQPGVMQSGRKCITVRQSLRVTASN